jgi:hypothetical protein
VSGGIQKHTQPPAGPKPITIPAHLVAPTPKQPAYTFVPVKAKSQKEKPASKPIDAMEVEDAPMTPTPSETTAWDLLGSNYKAPFKQRNIGNCYLLAAYDALQHHPMGPELLNRIKIVETPGSLLKPGKAYTVIFPSGKRAEFTEDEIGVEKVGKKPLDGPKAMQFMELAYSKATRSERNRKRDNPFADEGRGHSPIIMESGVAKDALVDMFGGEEALVTSEDIEHAVKNTDPLAKNPEGRVKLITFLRDIEKDTQHHYILAGSTAAKSDTEDTITLTRREGGMTVHESFPRGHAFSIRAFDLDKSTITVANPHDTSKQETLKINDFCKVFWRVSGVKLPKGQHA